MKKSMILSLTIVASMALTAFMMIEKQPPAKGVGWIDFCLPTCNSGENAIPEFHYEVANRFRATITKSEAKMAKSILDLVPAKANWDTHPIYHTSVALMVENGETVHSGTDSNLTEKQLNLLQKAEYSDDLRVVARCEGFHEGFGGLDAHELIYYISVKPEVEARYNVGHSAFVAYLKDNSQSVIKGLAEDRIRPGKAIFTVTTEGQISNVKLTSSSGFESVDDHMVKLLKETPGSWEPARNDKGEKVDQVLVFSFGKIGC